MIFTATALPGAWVIEPEPIADHRGFFARTWCRRELAGYGLETEVAQRSLSFNRVRGTLRGMHYQAEPHEEVKLVRCLRGSVYDVVLDLRPRSPAYLEHFAIELTDQNRRTLYIPKGVAHGFQTLEDSTEIEYQMSEFYHPGAGRGVRWNDPAFGIDWPIPRPTILDRDASYPLFEGSAGTQEP